MSSEIGESSDVSSDRKKSADSYRPSLSPQRSTVSSLSSSSEGQTLEKNNGEVEDAAESIGKEVNKTESNNKYGREGDSTESDIKEAASSLENTRAAGSDVSNRGARSAVSNRNVAESESSNANAASEPESSTSAPETTEKENELEGPKFAPPLYQQRYCFVQNVLTQKESKHVSNYVVGTEVCSAPLLAAILSPIHFQGQKSKVKVTMGNRGNYFVKATGSKLLSVLLSNLTHRLALKSC